MASTFGSLQTPIFTGKNYEYLSLTMKALFRGQDVWEIVQHGYAEPTDMTAYNNLTQAEKDESILPRVAAKTNAKQAWDTLETAYQGLDKVRTSKLQGLRLRVPLQWVPIQLISLRCYKMVLESTSATVNRMLYKVFKTSLLEITISKGS